MSPTLCQAYRRKWWIAVTSVIENLMFAAVLLGWSSLLLMLKNEGFYASMCYHGNASSNQQGNITDHYNGTADASPGGVSSSSENDTKNSFPHMNRDAPTVRFTPSGYPTCSAQEEILNRYFSIGSSLLSGVTIILGVIMDKYGSRMMRLCGTWAFIFSCLLFAIGSLDTKNYSVLMAPAVCLNGMGGIVYVFTSFPVPNLFENLRSTMISLMVGSYSASAVMYMIFKAAYDAGVPFVAIMLFHAAVGFLTFLNCYFNTPGEPIPGPDDLNYCIKLRFGGFRFDHKITGKKFLRHTSDVGKRMSSLALSPADNLNYLTSMVDLKEEHAPSEAPSSFLSLLITPCVMWSFVTMCITQLRLIGYMGGLELYFRSSCAHKGYTEEKTTETVEFYALLFGLLQINCFIMAPIIGSIMDWNLKNKKSKVKARNFCEKNANQKAVMSGGHVDNRKDHMSNGKSNSNGVANDNVKGTKSTNGGVCDKMTRNKRKKQQVMNLFRAFLITNSLLVLFGIVVLFEKMLELQILAFIIHTAIRTFLHSSTGGLYACMYHFSHFGKLTGVASFLSAMFILIQDPLFVVINDSFGGDPFWINVGLLVVSLAGFGLPLYLWMVARRIQTKEYVEEEALCDIAEEEDPPFLSSMAIAL